MPSRLQETGEKDRANSEQSGLSNFSTGSSAALQPKMMASPKLEGHTYRARHRDVLPIRSIVLSQPEASGCASRRVKGH